MDQVALSGKTAATDERGYLLTGDPKFVTEVNTDHSTASAALTKPHSIATPTEASKLNEIGSEIQAWFDAIGKEFAQYKTDLAGAQKIALGDNRTLRKAYEAKVTAIVQDATKEVASRTTASQGCEVR